MSSVIFRQAEPADLTELADLWDRSRTICLPFLPKLHSRDEDIAFLAGYVRHEQLILAQTGAGLAGFMALTPGWIEQLYLDPSQRRHGIGRSLVNLAKASRDQLQLWCFAANAAAQGFYVSQGFVQQRRTDGDNEAGLPDILYGWQRSV